MRQLKQIAIFRGAGPDHAEALDVLARLTEQFGSARNAALQMVRQHPLYKRTLREMAAGDHAPAAEQVFDRR